MIEMLVGAVIFGTGLAVGRLLPRRKHKPKAVEAGPLCQCAHGASFHDVEGRCRAGVERAKWNNGAWVGNELLSCECQKYTGPEPLPSFYAPELPE